MGGETDRRDFFAELARRVLGRAAEFVESKLPSPPSVTLKLLRPPGAIDETRFVDACQRCGKCVEVCPAKAIKPVESETRALNGTPFIDADLAACVVCEGLLCTHVCPSGALLPVAMPAHINMGLAKVYETSCVRTNGEDCRICVERCPLGASAILIVESRATPVVVAEGCVGCGVCQYYCPTTPKAIVVQPT